MDKAQALKQLFLEEVNRRLFDENFPRLKQCLGELSEEEIWYKPNISSNSVGNLVLHLQGNVRQWVIVGLGGAEDSRQRQKEFDTEGPIATNQLLSDLELLIKEVRHVLNKVAVTDLLEVREVQCYQESGLSILVHVVEHFSYHVGQISYIVKMLKNKQLGYYEGHDLEAKQ